MGLTVYPTSPGGTGNVGGGSNLTTANSVVIVSSSGVVTQSTLKNNGGILYPTANSTTAVQVNKADGTTNVVTVDTTNGRVGIGTIAPETILGLSKASNPTITQTDTTAYTGVGGAGSIFGSLSMIGSLNGGVATNSIKAVVNNSNGVSRADWVFYTADGDASSIEKMRILWDGSLKLQNTGGTFQTFLVKGSDGTVGIGKNNTSPTGTLHVYDATASTGATTLTVQAGAGQSSTNLQEWKNNAGTNIAKIGNDGSIYTGTAQLSSVGSSLYGLGSMYVTGSFGGPSGGVYSWSSGGTPYSSIDTALSRIGAGIVGVGTGAAGSTAGYLQADIIGSGTTPTVNLGAFQGAKSRTITGTVADGLTSALTMAPTYDAATAQTVTRHNYIKASNVTLTGAGPAAVTDAAVVWFDAAAGTHKAVDSGTTKTTPGTVDAWVKVNVNGTIYYMPAYTSKTT